MRKLINKLSIATLLALVFLFASPAKATQTFVQNVSTAYPTGLSTTRSLAPTTFTSGNFLFHVVTWFTNDTLSVADDKSDFWVCLPRIPYNTTGIFLQACYVFSAVGGSTTITDTWSGTGSTFAAASVSEYSGGLTTIDKTASTTSDALGMGTSISSGNVTTTQADELIIGYGSANTNKNWTAGGSFTLRTNNTSFQLGQEEQLDKAIGTYNTALTVNTTTTWGGGIATFYTASASPVVHRVINQ